MSAAETKKATKPTLAKAPTGIQGLDEVTGGGLPAGRPTLVCGGLRGAEILLVAVTGYGQEEDRRQTAAVGFDHHLVKPVEPKALENLLVDWKKRKGQCKG